MDMRRGGFSGLIFIELVFFEEAGFELVAELSDDFGVVWGDVEGFFFGGSVVVEFDVAVFVEDEAVLVGADGMGVFPNGDGGVAVCTGLLKLRVEALTLGKWRRGKLGKGAEGGEEVEGVNGGLGGLAGGGEAGVGDDEGRAEGFFKEVVFTPHSVFTKVPAVVSPEDDDRVFVGAGGFELGEDLADGGIYVADAGGVVLT